jgi:hypothetical protein
MKLQNSLKSLILEIASIETVIDAIKNKRVMGTSYDGDEPGGKGQRLIEPVCVGISKAGNRVVRAWEREGASHTATIGTQPLPGWRLFRLDKTFTFLPTTETFNEVRPGFNPNGDKSMVSIEVIVNFSTPARPSIIPQQFQTPNVDSIIDNTITSLKDEFTRKYGEGGFDLSKSAEAFKRIYAAIESSTNKKLTDSEKNDLRTTITNKLNQ